MKKRIAAIVTGAALMVMAFMGFGPSANASTTNHQTAKGCASSFSWVAGQQKAAGWKNTSHLRSDADAIGRYPGCNKLGPQILNVLVAPKVNNVGKAVWVHWRSVKK